VAAEASNEAFLRGHLSLHVDRGDPSNYRACATRGHLRMLGLQHP
jgi:hypothetical protein